MRIVFDAAKDEANRTKHGVSLEAFPGLDEGWSVQPDDRRDYGERRFRALGLIGGDLHCVVFTFRSDTVRLISLRRAHRKELG